MSCIAVKEFDGKANIIAGSTDIVGLFKDNVFAEVRRPLLILKRYPAWIMFKKKKHVKIGPLLCWRILPIINCSRAIIPLLPKQQGTPLPPSEMGTIGGNICQFRVLVLPSAQ